MPKWGDSQRYTIGYANQMWGSDIDALMLEAQYTLIRTFARKHRFVLRSHLGWIETSTTFRRICATLPAVTEAFAATTTNQFRPRMRTAI